MEITFRSKKLEKSVTDDRLLSKTYGTMAKKIKQRMTQLGSAENLKIIAKNKVLRLHPYKGHRKGEWSVDIQANWRLCFEISQDPVPKLADGGVSLSEVTAIRIISVEDPH